MIGQPISRVDGPLKVSGQVTYAYEYRDAENPLYGSIVGATIGRGRIKDIDTSRAEQSLGVRAVMTYRNAPVQGEPEAPQPPDYWQAQPVLNSPEIYHYGQPVALVVATTLEGAQAAGKLVAVEYDAQPGDYDFATSATNAYEPKSMIFGLPTTTAVGDFGSAFDNAAVKVDERYTTPYQFSQPMELNACLAVPHGDKLTIYAGAQIVSDARTSIAKTLGISVECVQVVSSYIGGGFGSKLFIHAETILAALAARQLKQPVKVSMTRQQIFHMIGTRPTSQQRVRLGADHDGRLLALAHEVNMFTNQRNPYAEGTAFATRRLYAAPNRLTRHELTPLDLVRGEDVRAPGDAPGLLALESAMDELADALGMDPIELRIINEPSLDPEGNVPFSDRRLVDCMQEGARRFGWEHRPTRPGSQRDGQWLIGYGMAAAMKAHPQTPTNATVRMQSDGVAVVQSDMTDLGTGTYTILTQVAAEGLGLSIDAVRVELGRSEYPVSGGSGGSWGAANSSVAVEGMYRSARETPG